MIWQEYPIASCIGKCLNWSPKSSGVGSFDYIDLSSINKSTKSIVSTKRHEYADAPSRARQLVEKGDVLIATVRPNLNGVALVNGDHHGMTASTGYCVLRPDKDKLDSRFLFHWVKTDVFVRRMIDVSTGANYPAVSDAKVKASKIPLPPLAEQKRIARILDAADTLRVKRREALAQLDTLLQSTFLEIFGDPVTNPKGWEVMRLTDVFWLQEGPGVRNWQFREFGVKLLNVSNILKSGELDLSKTDRRLAADEVGEKYAHFLVDAGDLVAASSGISIDDDGLLRTRSAFVENKHLPLCMNTSTVRFKATDGISDLRFLQQWLQSHEFRRQITREVTGIAQKNFGPTHLKRLRITLPPFDVQRDFATIAKSVERQKTQQYAYLTELDTLFASLQSRAFRGEL